MDMSLVEIWHSMGFMARVVAVSLVGMGFLSLFVADCTRTIKPLAVRARVVNFPRPARRNPAFELAA